MNQEIHFSGKVATKVIIVKDGKVLMARDNKDADIWDLPGGRINVGENIEDGIKREVKEELGVNVNFNSMVYSENVIHTSTGTPHLFITCKVNMLDPEQPFMVPSEELAEIMWVDRESFEKIKTFDSCVRALKTFWKL